MEKTYQEKVEETAEEIKYILKLKNCLKGE